jgi:hypothetical protein
MSSTRYTPPDSPLSPERFASSPEIERGPTANRVALRTAQLEDQKDIELIWSLQAESHRFEAVAAEILARWPERKANLKQIEARHRSDPEALERRANEALLNLDDAGRLIARSAEALRHLNESRRRWSDRKHNEILAAGLQRLPELLAQFCLDPAIPVADGWPECFPTLCSTLRERQEMKERELEATFTHTALSRSIWRALDDARRLGGTILLHNGVANGKSHAAQAYCHAHPGAARYYQVPATNDMAGFFRGLAVKLGMAAGLSWKVGQMRERIQRVLQTRQILLVLDSAQFLFPVTDYRYALPERVNWLLTACSECGVPVALVADSKLFDTLGFVEIRTGWDRRQLVNQLHCVTELAGPLGREDVQVVAGAILHDGDRHAQRKLADYMTVAPSYLHAGNPAAARARRIAVEHGRDRVTLRDMEAALKVSMVPSLKALDAGMKRADAAKDRCRGKKGTRSWTAPGQPAKPAARRSQIRSSSDFAPPPEQEYAEVATLPQSGRRITAASLQRECDHEFVTV